MMLLRDVLRGVPLDVSGVSGTAAGIDREGYLRVIAGDGVTHRMGSGSVTTHGPLGLPSVRPGADESSG